MKPGDIVTYTTHGFDSNLRRVTLSEIVMIISEAKEYASHDLKLYRVLLPNSARLKLVYENLLQAIL